MCNRIVHICLSWHVFRLDEMQSLKALRLLQNPTPGAPRCKGSAKREHVKPEQSRVSCASSTDLFGLVGWQGGVGQLPNLSITAGRRGVSGRLCLSCNLSSSHSTFTRGLYREANSRSSTWRPLAVSSAAVASDCCHWTAAPSWHVLLLAVQHARAASALAAFTVCAARLAAL